MGFLQEFKTKVDRYTTRKSIELGGAKKLHELANTKETKEDVSKDIPVEPEKTNEEVINESAESQDTPESTSTDENKETEEPITTEDALETIKKYDAKIIEKLDKNIQKISDICYDISANILPVIEKDDIMNYLFVNKAEEVEIIMGVFDEIMTVCEDDCSEEETSEN